MSSSQIFTIGTALRRAEDNNIPVEVLVEGQWLRGSIAGLDGEGLVLVTPERVQCVVRGAHISVVRILSDLPFEEDEPSEPRPASTYGAGPTTTATSGSTAASDPAEAVGAWAMPEPERHEAAPPGHTERWALEADDEDDVLVLSGTAEEAPLEIEAASVTVLEAEEEPTAEEEPAEEEAEEEPTAEEEPAAEEEPEEEPTAEEEPAVAVEPVAEEPAAEEEPLSLVDRLLRDSMREAGIDPGTADEANAEDAEAPRVFALPAPDASRDERPADESPVEVVADEVAPEPSPEPASADENPADETPADETPAEDASDWRAILHAVRAEATAPSAEPAPERRKGRRLVMR